MEAARNASLFNALVIKCKLEKELRKGAWYLAYAVVGGKKLSIVVGKYDESKKLKASTAK